MVIFNAKFGSEYVIRIVFKLIRLVGYCLNIKSNCFNIKSKGIVLASIKVILIGLWDLSLFRIACLQLPITSVDGCKLDYRKLIMSIRESHPIAVMIAYL